MIETMECHVLSELLPSSRGRVCLGRIEAGESAGRVVILRDVTGRVGPDLLEAVQSARNISHPKLLKTLGIAVSGDQTFVATEYVPGVCLSELIRAVRSQRRGMLPGAAVRVTLDMLALVQTARSLLRGSGIDPGRQLFADRIWLAEFGETMLTEIGTLHLMTPAADEAPAGDPESQDVLAAGVELFQLVTARLMAGDMCASARQFLSAPLARALEGAFSCDFTWKPPSARDFSQSLSQLPPALLGTQTFVAEELTRLVATVLDDRRKLAGFDGNDPRALGSDTPTRAFSALAAVSHGNVQPRNSGTGARSPTSRPVEARAAALPEARTAPPRLVTGLSLPLVERILLGVLVVLVVVTGVLAASQPQRVRLLVEQLKQLTPQP